MTDYEGHRVAVRHRDGPSVHRIGLIDLNTEQPVTSGVPTGEITAITSLTRQGNPAMPRDLLLWDDVDLMIAWVYARAPATVKTWRFGARWEFRDAAEAPIATGFPRYDLKRPIPILDLPWRIVDRESMPLDSEPVALLHSEEAAQAEVSRLNVLHRLRAYDVPEPDPRTLMRKIASQAADQALRHAATGAVLASTPQQIGAVLRDHAATAYTAGRSPHPLDWRGVTINFATGLRFGPADAAYADQTHLWAGQASGSGYAAVLTTAGLELRLPLLTPRQTDYLGGEVYSAVAATLRPADANVIDYLLVHGDGQTFQFDEDRAVGLVIDWPWGIPRGDLAEGDVQLTNYSGGASRLSALQPPSRRMDLSKASGDAARTAAVAFPTPRTTPSIPDAAGTRRNAPGPAMGPHIPGPER